MPKRTVIACPSCRTQSPFVVETVIDASRDPDAKVRLLSGRINSFRCPNCGAPINLSAPVLYHDPAHELLMAYVPMELNLGKDGEQRILGELMNELNTIIPRDQFKGYMFQPKQTLSMQGLIDAVLQADGVTPEMMAQQKERVRILETLLGTPPDQLEAVIQQYDAQIDMQFMQTLSLMIQRTAAEGQPEIAEQMMDVQEMLMANTAVGAELLEQAKTQRETVQAVADELNAYGANITRSDFVNVVVGYAEDDQKLQALVGLARPALDYQFFEELTTRIGSADENERPRLESLRDRLLQLTQMVDAQAQAALAEAAGILRTLVNSPEQDMLIQQNLGAFDDTFMAVLSANIQESERRGDIQMSGKLKELYNKIMGALRETMQPELQFINDLLSQPSQEQAVALIRAEAPQFGPGLLEWFDMVQDAVAQRGDPAIAERLNVLRQEVEGVLNR